MQIVETGFRIVVITAVTERVDVANRTAVIVRNRVVAPCIIGVMSHLDACGCVNIHNVTEDVFAVVVGSTVVGETENAVHAVQISERIRSVGLGQNARTVKKAIEC